MRDLLVVQIDPTRLDDPEIASEGERDRLKALAARYSREDLMRAFDLLSRAEYEIRDSSQPRHQFEMALVKWIHLRKLTPLEDLIASMQSGGSVPLTPAPGRQAAPPRPAAPPAATAGAASRTSGSTGQQNPGTPGNLREPQGTTRNLQEPQGTPGNPRS